MQQKHLHLIEAIVLTSSLVVPVRAQYPGSDGSATGPVLNTVPCRHATGNWGDSLGNTYNITTSLVNNTVAGSASVVGEPGCPRVGYTVSGSITPVGGANFLQRGTTTYNIHLTNPSYASCGGLINVNVDLSGDFRNDGCDIGFGPWHNVDNSGSGTCLWQSRLIFLQEKLPRPWAGLQCGQLYSSGGKPSKAMHSVRLMEGR